MKRFLFTNCGDLLIKDEYLEFYKINKYILWGHDIIERNIDPKKYDNLLDSAFRVKYKPEPWLFDRTDNRSLDLIEAFEERAYGVYSKYDKISILWSGGIDSTFMVSLFLNNVPKERLNIIYNDASIREAPGIFRILQEKQVKMSHGRDFSVFQSSIDDKNNCLVSGVLADFILGVADLPEYVKNIIGIGKNQLSVFDFFLKMKKDPNIYKAYGFQDQFFYWLNNVSVENIFPLVDKFIERSYMPINGMYDYIVYMCHELPYNTCKYYHHDLFRSNYENIITFFEYPKIETIGVNRRQDDRYIKDDYKLILKKYIYRTLNDYDYFKNKKKEHSSYLNTFKLHMLAMDENFKKYFIQKKHFFFPGREYGHRLDSKKMKFLCRILNDN